MKTPTRLVHEPIHDVPLLIGLAQKLRLPELLDHHLGSHGNHRGLSIGSWPPDGSLLSSPGATTPRSMFRSGLKVSVIL